MAKILLLEREFDLGDSLKTLLEQDGHPTDWRQKPEEIKKAYDNPPKYDVVIVDRCCDERNPSFTCDELVKKLKQTYPKKEVICLTHPRDPCKYADNNFIVQELLDEFRISDVLREQS